MSLGLIKPGMSAAARVYPTKHSRAGQPIEPLYVTKDGREVWPVFGGAPENGDEDDPNFTGDDDEDDDQDEDEDDESKSSKTKKSKPKKSDEDDEDNDEDEDDEKDSRPHRQAARYRTQRNELRKELAEVRAELQAIRNKDKPADELASEELTNARKERDSLAEVNRIMSAQLAFFKTNTGITWVDPSDAFALAEREGLFDDVIDEDGTVDTRELRRGLRDLAKRKKYLVKSEPTRGRKDEDETEGDDDDDEPRSSRKSAPKMNGRRKGGDKDKVSREALAARFPVLRSR